MNVLQNSCKVFGILLSLLLVFCVAACGKSEEKKYDYNFSEYVTIGQFKGIEVPAKELETTREEAVETIYSFLAQNQAVSKMPVTDRPVKNGDFVNIDYEGLRDGVAFKGGTAKGVELEIGSDTYIDGFEEGLIGANIGDTVALNLTFPEKYPQNTDLEGQPVVFNVKINSIKAYSYPEIDEEFLKENFSEYTSPEVFIEDIRKSCSQDKKINYVQEVMFGSATIIKYPEKELKEFEDGLKDMYQQYADSYGIKIEEFVENYVGIKYDDFVSEATLYAQEQVKTQIVCLAIAEREGIALSTEEFDSYAAEYAEDYGYQSAAECIDKMGRENIRVLGIIDKIVNIATESAVVK